MFEKSGPLFKYNLDQISLDKYNKIIIDGIVSVYVDNEYLEYSDRGTKYKQKIIQELLSFFKYLTKFSEEKVFMIYTRQVKKYRMKGFCWDNIPY